MTKMLKKLLCMVCICAVVVFSLAACGGGNGNEKESKEAQGGADASDWPKKDIHVLVGFSAGGTSDLGTRLLFEAAKEELGVNIIVDNVTGAGGWNAWSQLADAAPDGYTLALVTDPTIYGGYLDPSNNRQENLDSFTMIVNHVMDDSCIAISPDETRFTDFDSLIEYAKENEVTATTTGIGSQVHLMMLRMNDELGTKFVPLATSGTSEGKTMVLGGNVDCFFACVGDIAPSHNTGELKCVAVSSEERSEYMDDVPTMVELGYPLIHCYSSRGIMGPAGMDEAVVEKLSGILERAMASDQHKEEMDKMSLRINFIGHEDFKKQMYDDEEMMKSYAGLFGWE